MSLSNKEGRDRGETIINVSSEGDEKTSFKRGSPEDDRRTSTRVRDYKVSTLYRKCFVPIVSGSRLCKKKRPH